MHRALILVLATCCLCAAADREQFTLKDGRVLVGTYDEASQTLNIENPKASMHVDARDIVRREEAPPAVEPAAKPKGEPRPDARSADASVPAYAASLPKLAEALKTARAQARQADDAAQKASRDLDIAWEDAAETFLESADLTPITINVPQNPTQADLNVAQEKRQFNETLARIVEDKKDPKRRAIRAHLVGRVPTGRDFFSQYGEWKGPAWVGELLGHRR